MTIIPLTADPGQSFRLDLEGNEYNIRVYYNARKVGWFIDISSADNVAVILGVALVLGTNLLGQYPSLELGGLFMFDTEDANTDAGESDLGSRVFLVSFTEEELADVDSV